MGLTVTISFASDRDIFSLKDRTAAITGAGSGLGRTFSSVLAAFGAQVLCLDRDMDAAVQTAELVREAGGKATAYPVDVTDDSSVHRFAQEVLASDISLDVLINNAGVISAPSRLHEMSDQAWSDVLDVSLNGTFRCTRALLPVMLKHGSGSIINVSSIMGLTGFYPEFPGISGSYNAAKAGLIGLTRQVAVEYAQDNIRCNAVAPGWHQGTNLGARRKSAGSSETARRFDDIVTGLTPMRRKGYPEELRGLIVLLASDASSYITGQVFVQDGGWTAI